MYMSVNFTLQFIDQNGEPLKYKQVSVINSSNIFSTSNMYITDHNGNAHVSFFSLYKSIKAQIYFEYHRISSKTIKKGEKIALIMPQKYLQAI